MTVFSAVVDPATGHVIGVHSGKTQPLATATQEFLEVTQSEYATISGQLRHEQQGPPRWQRSGGSIVEVEDTRPQLQITLDKTEAAVGEFIAFDFQVLDKDGNPITPTATRKLRLQSDDGRARHWRVTVVSGAKSGSKAISEPGIYRFYSDGSYRVVGDISFAVYDDF